MNAPYQGAMYGRPSTSIRLNSGLVIDLVDPSPESILLEDIAHGLSRICRYGGHTAGYYSVAEHSVLACRLAYEDGMPASTQLNCLLHDAAEAYIGDVVRPLKNAIAGYQEISDRLDEAISIALGFEIRHSDLTKFYDNVCLAIEMRFLWGREALRECQFSEEVLRRAACHTDGLRCLDHNSARNLFASEFILCGEQ